ncbi:MAG: hypothetical protein R2838_07100 [Caldilineaceae bacterium]
MAKLVERHTDFVAGATNRNHAAERMNMADFEQLHTAIAALPTVAGIVPVDLLSVPQPLGGAIRGLVRNKAMDTDELAEVIGVTPDEARQLIDLLVEKGYLLTVDGDSGDRPRFCIRYARLQAQHPLGSVSRVSICLSQSNVCCSCAAVKHVSC